MADDEVYEELTFPPLTTKVAVDVIALRSVAKVALDHLERIEKELPAIRRSLERLSTVGERKTNPQPTP